MGQASTKLDPTTDTLQAIDDVITAAEKARCGRHSLEVFQQAAVLRELRAQWVSGQQEAQDLHGQQVYAVAAALHALQTKLEWYKRKLRPKHLPSIRTLTTQQQAAHVLRVLRSAQEALMQFATAFKLQVLLSRQVVLKPPALPEQLHADVSAGEGASDTTDAAARGVALVVRASQPSDQHHSLQEQQQQQPGEVQEQEDEVKADSSQEGQLQDQPAGHDDTAAAAAVPPCPQPAAELAAQPAEKGAKTEHALAGSNAGAAVDESGVALWEHSEAGWQELLQRAWRGDGAAVLACARELMHGGDFCLQDFGLARQLLHTTAQQSCGTSCLWLGQLCERGLGLPAPDLEEAASWYGSGAALGHLECAQALAFFYQHGLGLEQDLQAALEWHEFAAEGGLAAAQNNLGQLLQGAEDGDTEQHAEAAVRLFQAAADQGSAVGWQNLGVCHELGVAGQGPDAAAAEACYRQAGTPKALLRLGQLLLQQHAHAAGRQALAAAAEAGSVEALLLLATLQDSQAGGYTTQQQPDWGAVLSSSSGSSSLSGSWVSHTADVPLQQLHRAAAKAGVPESQHVVACSCWSGGKVQTALQWWHAAAAQGYGLALLCLGAVAETGSHGVRRDPAAARACYAQAAASGSKQAAARLAALDQECALRALHSSGLNIVS